MRLFQGTLAFVAGLAFASFASISAIADDSVNASSFGYNAEDATECLQKAIDSGVKTVVVDKQTGPWIVRPITLRSDLELVLQEGTEIVAKQGEFRSKGECLLRASQASNVTIRGEGKGATLRMRKRDYWNEPYEKSEWRHGVSLLSSENVAIENLTIAETGGDGIYLGVSQPGVPCRNITIKNVDCVANNRQGISVISVDGLLIEDCLLRDTVGTPPAAGIDFEPNRDDEQITNVVMRRVKAIDNKGSGFDFYLYNLKNFGEDLSITMEDCQAVRNNGGFIFTARDGEDRIMPGKIEVVDSDFIGNFIGVAIRSKWADGAPFAFKNVRIVTPSADKAVKYGDYVDYNFSVQTNEAVEKWAQTTVDSGVSLIAVGTDVDVNGGFSFENVEIIDACADAPDFLFLLRDASSEVVGFDKINGSVKSTKLDETGTVKTSSVVELNDQKLYELFPQLNMRKVEGFDFKTLNDSAFKDQSAELIDAWSGNAAKKQGFRTRGGATYYFYAASGETFSWTLQQRKIGNYPLSNVGAVIKTPSGKEIALDSMPDDAIPKAYEFKAEEDGWFRLELAFGASTVELTSDDPILTAARPSLDVCGNVGTFRFYVPNGSKDLGLRVVGSPSERVTATIVDPDGKQVEKLENVSALGSWSIDVDETTGLPVAPKPGFWTLKLERPTVGVLEDYIVTILGVPALIR
ncbi:MAG: right-handed parallel beta-helix repeat-containing protein [Thermoguttaceae bacterium]|nr:right-handed parallel beta-helix repeat-containing protein [Thermoguttaceae bacterium]